MNLKQHFLTKNECYITYKEHEVKGLMLHSTAANNPFLNRYIDIPNENYSVNHWNQFRPNGKQVCVHGFIGKLSNGEIATYQTLPFNIAGWHSGTCGTRQSDVLRNANNNGYLGFEICEDNLDDKEYFEKVYKESVELFAYLCNEFNLNPLKDIICHSEGYKLGIASNHADVMHWFSKFDKDMDMFRFDVEKELKKIKKDVFYKVKVQFGAFKDKEKAMVLKKNLELQGYYALIEEDNQSVIDMNTVTLQIHDELRKEYEDKYNTLKNNILEVLNEVK